MVRSNNTLLLFVVVGLLVIFGIYCIWEKKPNLNDSEKYSHSKRFRENRTSKSDIEFIAQSDEVVDDFQLLDVTGENPAFQIGFGMGPGLYGSGRHTSEMIGN